jgi:hypothetical protein
MKRFSVNIQIVVAVIFTLLFVTATVTTLFGQEKTDASKKEQTKFITLKVTEDENGNVTRIDTTMIFKGDEAMKSQNKFIYKFDLDGNDVSDEDVMIWMDDMHNVHKLHSSDSMMFIGKDGNVMKRDSMMKIMVSVEADDEDVLIDIMEDGEQHVYKYKIDSDIDGDSIQMIIKQHLDDHNCKDVEKIIMKHGGGSGSAVFITDDGDVQVLDEDISTTMRIKTIGAEGMDIIRDTIIEDGEHKIIIKTNVSPDGKEEKTVQVFTIDADGNEDIEEVVTKEITVEVDGDDVNVWTTDKGDSYKFISKSITIELQDAKEDDIKELKDAGIKTKKRALDVENLKFSPNPSNGKINLSFTLEEMKDVTINIYDINGRVVYTETIKNFQGSYQKEIDISDKGTGAFFLQIVQGLYDVIKKIIIQ